MRHPTPPPLASAAGTGRTAGSGGMTMAMFLQQFIPPKIAMPQSMQQVVEPPSRLVPSRPGHDRRDLKKSNPSPSRYQGEDRNLLALPSRTAADEIFMSEHQSAPSVDRGVSLYPQALQPYHRAYGSSTTLKKHTNTKKQDGGGGGGAGGGMGMLTPSRPLSSTPRPATQRQHQSRSDLKSQQGQAPPQRSPSKR